MKFAQKDIYNYTITVARMILLGGDYKKYLEALHEDERVAVKEKLKIIAKEIGELGCQK
jgi:hypothetical protein